MSRNLKLYFEDIIVAGEKVIRYTEGMGFTEFVVDERTFDAVVRNLQIIGNDLLSFRYFEHSFP